MKTYDGLNYSDGKHTIKVTLQDGEYKGYFTYTVGGNCKGFGVLDFDISTDDQDSIEKHYKCHGCMISRPDNNDYLNVKLTDPNGETCDFEVGDDDFMSMVVGVEIIDFKAEE